MNMLKRFRKTFLSASLLAGAVLLFTSEQATAQLHQPNRIKRTANRTQQTQHVQHVRAKDGRAYAGRSFSAQASWNQPARAGSVLGSGPILQGGPNLPTPAVQGEIIQGPAIGPVVGGPVVGGDVVYESGPVYENGSCATGDCNGSCGGDSFCSDCGGEGCEYCCEPDVCVPLCLPRFKYLAVFGGVHGFKGPRDSGFGNNFGFQEGFNISGRMPLIPINNLAYQLGYQTVQSRLHGDVSLNSKETRVQQFITAGVFHRRKLGLQWGVVYDIMLDDLQVDLDFAQVRAEVSIVGPRGGEFGFMTAVHANDTGFVSDNVTTNFQAVDQYMIFYRWNLNPNGEFRVWGGLTDNNDGLFGADFLFSMNDRWSLQGGFNYLSPDESVLPQSAIQESWNLGLNLVWHFDRKGRSSLRSPFRPLFNVANNGSMFIDQLP